MATIIDPPNSVWPNGLKVDSEGYVTFYPLGTNKIDINDITWPKGDKIISPFVYQDEKLVGFIDTKALTISENTTIYLPYEHIETEFSAIDKGQLQIHAPKAITKTASWKDSGVEGIPEAQFKYKGCKTVDNVKTVDANYTTTDIVDGAWSEPLWDLEQASNGSTNVGMFKNCTSLTSFSSDLPSLTGGHSMFWGCSNLTSFNGDLSSLTDGYYMFYNCSKLTSFPSNLSSLMKGQEMFHGCYNLTSFNSDLSSLTQGYSMFQSCTSLTSFNSNLSNLTGGYWMFSLCKLDTASVQNIADTINTYNGTIYIGIGNSEPNPQEETAFNTIASKGWTVYVNGSEYTPTSPAAITTLDENGEATVTPIPFWAKPVPTTEETASYVDANGNFFNIAGGQFIYGDDMSTYGMFTCEEDAATNMGLTKIERN